MKSASEKKDIWKARLRGETYSSIAKRVHLSRGRVFEIVLNEDRKFNLEVKSNLSIIERNLIIDYEGKL